MSLFANIALVDDLITSIKEPFNNSNLRLKKYLKTCLIVPLVIVIALVGKHLFHSEESMELYKLNQYWKKLEIKNQT